MTYPWQSGSRIPSVCTNAAGYRVFWCQEEKKLVYEHRKVWEHHNGPIPRGFHIHHRNGNKADNRIENLECLPPREHYRGHRKSFRRNASGEWIKGCTKCRRDLPTTEFYTRANRKIVPACKACCREDARKKPSRRGRRCHQLP